MNQSKGPMINGSMTPTPGANKIKLEFNNEIRKVTAPDSIESLVKIVKETYEVVNNEEVGVPKFSYVDSDKLLISIVQNDDLKEAHEDQGPNLKIIIQLDFEGFQLIESQTSNPSIQGNSNGSQKAAGMQNLMPPPSPNLVASLQQTKKVPSERQNDTQRISYDEENNQNLFKTQNLPKYSPMAVPHQQEQHHHHPHAFNSQPSYVESKRQLREIIIDEFNKILADTVREKIENKIKEMIELKQMANNPQPTDVSVLPVKVIPPPADQRGYIQSEISFKVFTISANQVIIPNKKFITKWKIQNTGQAIWTPNSIVLTPYNTSVLQVDTVVHQAIQPGEIGFVEVTFFPIEQPGDYNFKIQFTVGTLSAKKFLTFNQQVQETKEECKNETEQFKQIRIKVQQIGIKFEDEKLQSLALKHNFNIDSIVNDLMNNGHQ